MVKKYISYNKYGDLPLKRSGLLVEVVIGSVLNIMKW